MDVLNPELSILYSTRNKQQMTNIDSTLLLLRTLY